MEGFVVVGDMEDLKRVLNMFALNPFRLKTLLVWIQDLTVPLLQLLASRLPGLHSLVLLSEMCGTDIDYSFDVSGLLFSSRWTSDSNGISAARKICS